MLSRASPHQIGGKSLSIVSSNREFRIKLPYIEFSSNTALAALNRKHWSKYNLHQARFKEYHYSIWNCAPITGVRLRFRLSIVSPRRTAFTPISRCKCSEGSIQGCAGPMLYQWRSLRCRGRLISNPFHSIERRSNFQTRTPKIASWFAFAA